MNRLPYVLPRRQVAAYKGTTLRNDKWIARTSKGGHCFYLGTYPTECQAALAVNLALAILFPNLPARHFNAIPADQVPDPQDADDIRKEVTLRLSALTSPAA